MDYKDKILKRKSGIVSAWQSFWNQFESAIHDNPSLSITDKLNYLESLLSGVAANLVAGLSPAENYDNALRMLKTRFGRKDLIKNTHINKLLCLNPVKRANYVSALRKLYDGCEVHVRSLDAVMVVAKSYGSSLCRFS